MIFPIIGFFTLLGLLYAEYSENVRLKWIFKPATSLLFVLTALVRGIDGSYAILILIGLILGMVGDILLIPDSKKMFMLGTGAFLAGHVLYIVAFIDLLSEEHMEADSLVPPLELCYLPIILLPIGISMFLILRPRLGKMQNLVAAYIVVITVMLWTALVVKADDWLPQNFRNLVAVGAVCFYLSDLSVALDRFVKTRFKNAYWGLPLYYAAQFMIALSIAALE